MAIAEQELSVAWRPGGCLCAAFPMALTGLMGLPDAARAQATGTPTPGSTPSATVGIGHLPRDLSPWSMFLSADIVVQAVMIGLVFASIVTWTVWLAKCLELWGATRRLRGARACLGSVSTLAEALMQPGSHHGIAAALLATAADETQQSADIADKAAVKDRISTRLARLEVAAAREMNKGTGVIATIAATAPFVGLFGTVWGIMNSFIGISKAQSTNLAIVAPGIAEALLATALGLFAAIPAVIIYNQLARSIARYRAMVGDASAEVLTIASRDLDRDRAMPVRRVAE